MLKWCQSLVNFKKKEICLNYKIEFFTKKWTNYYIERPDKRQLRKAIVTSLTSSCNKNSQEMKTFFFASREIQEGKYFSYSSAFCLHIGLRVAIPHETDIQIFSSFFFIQYFPPFNRRWKEKKISPHSSAFGSDAENLLISETLHAPSDGGISFKFYFHFNFPTGENAFAYEWKSQNQRLWG